MATGNIRHFSVILRPAGPTLPSYGHKFALIFAADCHATGTPLNDQKDRKIVTKYVLIWRRYESNILTTYLEIVLTLNNPSNCLSVYSKAEPERGLGGQSADPGRDILRGNSKRTENIYFFNYMSKKLKKYFK